MIYMKGKKLKHGGALQTDSLARSSFHVNPVNHVYMFLRFADSLTLSHRFFAITLRDRVED